MDYNKKAFRLEGYVVFFVSVYTISRCFLCHDVVIVNIYFYLYLPPETIRFSVATSQQWLGGRHFRL